MDRKTTWAIPFPVPRPTSLTRSLRKTCPIFPAEQGGKGSCLCLKEGHPSPGQRPSESPGDQSGAQPIPHPSCHLAHQHERHLIHRALAMWLHTSQRSSQPEEAQLTMSTHACFPSMKPLGMELGVRISYLRKKENPGQFTPCFNSTWPGIYEKEDRPHSATDVEILSQSLLRKSILLISLCSALRLNGTRKVWYFPESEQKLTLDYFTHPRVSFRVGC